MAQAGRNVAAGASVEKSPEAFRTISEVAAELDVPAHVLRFWESKFTQVRPLKRGGRRRYYRPEDVELLRRIRALLYTEGYTIKGVQKVLRERGVKRLLADPEEAPSAPPAAADGGGLDADTRARLEHAVDELIALRDLLRDAGG